MELSNKNNQLKVSVFLMMGLSIFLLAFIFFMVGSNQKMFDAKYSLYMFLPNIESLNPGAFVTLSGLKVGVVGELKFTTRNNQQGILIELKIDKDYARRITASSKAVVKTMGILGDKYVDISLGNPTEPPLRAGMFIRSEPPVNANELFADAAAALTDLRGLLTNFHALSNRVVDGQGIVGSMLVDRESGKNLIEIIRNLKAMTQNLVQGQGNLGKALQDTAFYASLVSTSRKLEMITTRIEKGKGTVGKLLADTTLYVNVKRISARTDSLLQKLQGNGTVGRLLSDEELYNELLQLTREVKVLTRDLQENPGKYVSFSIF